METYTVTNFASFKTAIENAANGDVINVNGVIEGTGETITTSKTLTLNVANGVKLENLKIDGKNITWNIAEFGTMTMDGDSRITAKTFTGSFSNVKVDIENIKETNVVYIDLSEKVSGVTVSAEGAAFVDGSGTSSKNYDYVLTITTDTLFINPDEYEGKADGYIVAPGKIVGLNCFARLEDALAYAETQEHGSFNIEVANINVTTPLAIEKAGTYTFVAAQNCSLDKLSVVNGVNVTFADDADITVGSFEVAEGATSKLNVGANTKINSVTNNGTISMDLADAKELDEKISGGTVKVDASSLTGDDSANLTFGTGTTVEVTGATSTSNSDGSLTLTPTVSGGEGGEGGEGGSGTPDSGNTEPQPETAIFTKDDKGVWHVGNLAGFKAFRDMVNDGNTFAGETVILDADIDLNNEEWTAIGNSTNKFQGTFDGNDKTVSNLLITGNKSYVGLFGFTTNGEIKNLTVNNAKVSGRLGVGVVAGSPYTSKYTNITVTGHVEVNGMAYVGGVGGRNAYASWTNITVDVDSTSYVNANSVEDGIAYRTYVGGVIGFMGEGGHTLSNITSNIAVSGSTIDVGGIVGIAHYGNNLENVSCSGSVTITNPGELADAKEVGGIAGVWNNGGSPVTMTDCEFTGSLTVKDNAEWTEAIQNNKLTGAAYSATGNGKLDVDFVELPYQVANGTVELKSTEITTAKQVIIGTGYGMVFNTTTPAEAGAAAELIIGKGAKVEGNYIWVGGDYKDVNGNKQPEDADNNYKLIVDGGELNTIGGGEVMLNVRYDGEVVVQNGGKVTVGQLNTKDRVAVSGEGSELKVNVNTTVAGGTVADNGAELIVKDGATASVGRLTVGSTDSAPEYGKVIIGAGSNITASKVTFNTNGSMVISFETADSAKSVTGLDVTGADALDYSKITLVVDGVTYTYQEAAGTMSLRAATVSEAGWYDENGNALLISGEMYDYTVSKGTGNDVILQAIAKPDTVYVNATFTAETAAARGLELGVSAFASIADAYTAATGKNIVAEGTLNTGADGSINLLWDNSVKTFSLADNAEVTFGDKMYVGTVDENSAEKAVVNVTGKDAVLKHGGNDGSIYLRKDGELNVANGADASFSYANFKGEVNVSGEGSSVSTYGSVTDGAEINVTDGASINLATNADRKAVLQDGAVLNVTDGTASGSNLVVDATLTLDGFDAQTADRDVLVTLILKGQTTGTPLWKTLKAGETSITISFQNHVDFADGEYEVQVNDVDRMPYPESWNTFCEVVNGKINLENGDLVFDVLNIGAGAVNMDVDSSVTVGQLIGRTIRNAENVDVEVGAYINLNIDSAKLVDGEGDKDVYKLIDITGDGDLKTDNMQVNGTAFADETLFENGEAKYNLVQMENDVYLVDDVKFNRADGLYVSKDYTADKIGNTYKTNRLVGYNAFASLQQASDLHNENAARYGRDIVVESNISDTINSLEDVNIQTNVEDGVTITNNYGGWTYYRDNVTIGEGVAVTGADYQAIVGKGIKIDGTMHTDGIFHLLWDGDVTLSKDAVLSAKGASVIRRDNAADTVDLTINGDDDGQTQFKIESDLGLYNGQVDANNTKIEVRFLNMKDYDGHYQSKSYPGYDNAKAELNLNNTDLVMNTTAKSELDGQATINVKDGSTVIAGNIDNAGTINVSGSDFDAKTVVNGTVVMLEMADGLDLSDASTSNRWNLEVTIFDADGKIVFQKAGMSNLQTSMPWIRLFGTDADLKLKNGGTYYYSIKQNGVELAKNPVDGKGGALLDMTNDVKSGTFTVAGESTLNIGTLTGSSIDLLDGAIVKDSTVGGAAFVAGNVTFRGDNTFGMLTDFGVLTDYYGTTAPMKWTVEEGASLTLTDKARYGLGYGDNVTIEGSIAANGAAAARATLSDDDASNDVKQSLFMHGLVAQESSGWNKTSYFTVKDAFVTIGSNNSFGNKPGNFGGSYYFNFDNSVLNASRITFYDTLSKTEFTLKNSDVVIGQFMTRDKDSVFTLDNTKFASTSTINGNDEGQYNAGTLNVINGSKLSYVSEMTNEAGGVINVNGAEFVAPGVKKNDGTFNVAGESTLVIDSFTGNAVKAADGTTLVNSTIKGGDGYTSVEQNGYKFILSVNGDEAGTLNLQGENTLQNIDAGAGDVVNVADKLHFVTDSDGFKLGNGAIWNITNAEVDGAWSLSLDGYKNSNDAASTMDVKKSVFNLQNISAKGASTIGKGAYNVEFEDSDVNLVDRFQIQAQETAAVNFNFTEGSTLAADRFINYSSKGSVVFDNSSAEFRKSFGNVGTVTVQNGATLTATYADAALGTEKGNGNSGTINVNNATLSLTGSTATAFNNSGAINVNGGKLTVSAVNNTGTFTVAGESTLNIGTLTGSSSIDLLDGAIIKDSTIGGGMLFVEGNVSFVGDNAVGTLNPGWYNHKITIGQGSSLKADGGRTTLSYGNTIDVDGTIVDAKTADKTAVKKSLDIVAGMSLTGNGNNATLDVDNAYVSFGGTSSKYTEATGNFVLDFNNSIVDFTNELKLHAPSTSTLAPEFQLNVKNSVFTVAKNFSFNNADSVAEFDNSIVNVKSNFRNAGKFILKNGTQMTVAANSDGSAYENTGNFGTLTVTGNGTSFNMVDATAGAYPFVNMAGAAINVADNAAFNVGKLTNTGTISVTSNAEFSVSSLNNTGTITVDATSLITAASIVNNGTITIDATGFAGDYAKVIDLNQSGKLTNVNLINGEGYYLEYGADGDVTIREAPNKLYVGNYTSADEDFGYTKFASYDTAFNFAKDNSPEAVIYVESGKTTNVESQNSLIGNVMPGIDTVIENGATVNLGGGKQRHQVSDWTVKAGGTLAHNGTNAKYHVGHMSDYPVSHLVVGEAGAAEKATLDFIYTNTSKSSLLIAVLGEMTANNATISVADLVLFGNTTLNDSVVSVDDLLLVHGAYNDELKGYEHKFTNTIVNVKGDSGRYSDNYSDNGSSLDSLTLTNSSIKFDDGVEDTVSEKVTLKNVTLNKSTITVEAGAELLVDGKVTMDYTSQITFTGVTTNAAFTIDTTGYSTGFYKVLDYTGAGAFDGDYKTMLGSSWNDNFKVTTGGDLILTNLTTDTIYINDAWKTIEDGTDLGNGKIKGYNAFGSFDKYFADKYIKEDTSKIVIEGDLTENSYVQLAQYSNSKNIDIVSGNPNGVTLTINGSLFAYSKTWWESTEYNPNPSMHEGTSFTFDKNVTLDINSAAGDPGQLHAQTADFILNNKVTANQIWASGGSTIKINPDAKVAVSDQLSIRGGVISVEGNVVNRKTTTEEASLTWGWGQIGYGGGWCDNNDSNNVLLVKNAVITGRGSLQLGRSNDSQGELKATNSVVNVGSITMPGMDYNGTAYGQYITLNNSALNVSKSLDVGVAGTVNATDSDVTANSLSIAEKAKVNIANGTLTVGTLTNNGDIKIADSTLTVTGDMSLDGYLKVSGNSKINAANGSGYWVVVEDGTTLTDSVIGSQYVALRGDLNVVGGLTVDGFWTGQESDNVGRPVADRNNGSIAINGDKVTVNGSMLLMHDTYDLNADVDAKNIYFSYGSTVNVNSTVTASSTSWIRGTTNVAAGATFNGVDIVIGDDDTKAALNVAGTLNATSLKLDGADDTLSVNNGTLTVGSLTNNGTINATGNSTIKVNDITGNGLVAAGYASIDKNALGDRVAAADRTNLTLDAKNIQAWGVRFANANVSFAQDTVFDLVDGANYVYNENASWDLNGNTVKVYGMFIGGGSAGKGGFTLKDGTLVLNTNHFADGSKRTGNITTCFQSYASTISTDAELLVEDTAHFCVYENLTVNGKVVIEKSGNGTAVGLNDYFFSDGANLVIDGANASFVQKSGNMNIYGEFNDTTGSVADGYAGYIQKSNLTVSNGAEFELTTGSIKGNGNITVKGTGSTATVGGDVAADIIRVNTGATLEVAGTVTGKGTAYIDTNGTLKAGNFYGGARVGYDNNKPATLIVTGTLDNVDDVLTLNYGSTAEIGTLYNNYTANVMSGSTMTAGTISNSGNLKVVDGSSLTADKIVNNNVSLKGSTNVKDASLTAGEIENNGLVTIAGESTLKVDKMTASGSKGALMGGWYVNNFTDWVSDSNAVDNNKLTISSKTAGQAADITQNKISFRDTELTLGSDVNFAINNVDNNIDKMRKFWMGEDSTLNLNDNKMTVKGMFQLEDADVAGTGSLDIYGNDGDAKYQYVSFVGGANNINADVNVKNADMVVFYAGETNITKNFTIDSVDNGILVGHGTESAYKNAALNVSGTLNAHGKMTVHETSALNVTGTGLVRVYDAATNNGTITVDAGEVQFRGNLTTSGDFSLTNNAVAWMSGMKVAGGNVTVDNATLYSYFGTDRKLTIASGSTLTVKNGATFGFRAGYLDYTSDYNFTSLENSGTIEISGDSDFRVNSVVNKGVISINGFSSFNPQYYAFAAETVDNTNGTFNLTDSGIDVKSITGGTINITLNEATLKQMVSSIDTVYNFAIVNQADASAAALSNVTMSVAGNTLTSGQSVVVNDVTYTFYTNGGDGNDVVLSASPNVLYLHKDYNTQTYGWGFDRFNAFGDAMDKAEEVGKSFNVIVESDIAESYGNTGTSAFVLDKDIVVKSDDPAAVREIAITGSNTWLKGYNDNSAGSLTFEKDVNLKVSNAVFYWGSRGDQTATAKDVALNINGKFTTDSSVRVGYYTNKANGSTANAIINVNEGATITATGGDFRLMNRGEVNLNKATMTTNGAQLAVNGGSLNAVDSTINAGMVDIYDNGAAYGDKAVIKLENSTMTVTNGLNINSYRNATGGGTPRDEFAAEFTMNNSTLNANSITNRGLFNVNDSTLKVDKLDNDAEMYVSGTSTIQVNDATGSSYAVRVKDGSTLKDSYVKSGDNATLRMLGSMTVEGGLSVAYLHGAEAEKNGVGGTLTIDSAIYASYGVEISNNYVLNGGKIVLGGGNADGKIWGVVFQDSDNITINTDVEVDGNTKAGDQYAPIHFTKVKNAIVNGTITQLNSRGEVIYVTGSNVTVGKDGKLDSTAGVKVGTFDDDSPVINSTLTVKGQVVGAGLTVDANNIAKVVEGGVVNVNQVKNTGKLLVDGSTLTAGKITGDNSGTLFITGNSTVTADSISANKVRIGQTYDATSEKVNVESGNVVTLNVAKLNTVFANTHYVDLTFGKDTDFVTTSGWVSAYNAEWTLAGANKTVNLYSQLSAENWSLNNGTLNINSLHYADGSNRTDGASYITFDGEDLIAADAAINVANAQRFAVYADDMKVKGSITIEKSTDGTFLGHSDAAWGRGVLNIDGGSFTQKAGNFNILGANAAGDVEASTLKVQNGGTFTLNNGKLNSKGNIVLSKGGKITLNSKGNEITGSLTGSGSGNKIYVGDYNNTDADYAGASLTIGEGATVDLKGDVYVGTGAENGAVNSELTIKGALNQFKMADTGFYVREDGKMTFDNVTVAEKSTYSGQEFDIYANHINVGGELVIDGTEVSLNNFSAGADSTRGRSAKVTLNDATLNVVDLHNGEFTLGYKANRNAEMTLNNSTINSAVDMTVGGSKDGGNTYGKASLSLTNGSTVNATNVNVGIGSTISVMDSTFNANKLNMTADDDQFTIGGSSKVNIQDASFNYIFVKDDTTLTDSYIGGDAVALLGDLHIVDADNSGYGLTVGGLWTGKHMVDGVETNLPDGSKITINGAALKVEGSMLLMHADYDLKAKVDAKNIYFSYGSTVNVNSTVTASSTSWTRGTTNVAAGATFNGVDIVIGDDSTKAALNVAGTLNAKSINLVDNDTLSLCNGNMTVAGDVTVNGSSILSVLNGSTVTVDGNVNVLNPTTGGGLVIMSTGNLQVDYTSTMVIKGSLNFTGLATYKIKADGWTGNTIKVIDTDGGINHDPAVSLSNANVVEFNGDVYLTKNTSTAVLYVDDDWAGMEDGDITSDGKIIGFNAFASLDKVADAATDATTGIEIAAGDYILSSDTLAADNATVTNKGGKVYFKDAVIDVNGYNTGVSGDGSYNEVSGTSKVNIDNLAGYYALRLADGTTLVAGTSIGGSTSVRAKGDLTVGDSDTSVVYINSFDNNDSDYTVDNTITVNGTWNISEAGKNYPTYWMGIQGGEGDAVTTLTGDGVINVNTTMILQGSNKGNELGNVVVDEDLEIKTGNIDNAHMRFTNVNLTIKGSVENLSTVNSFNAIGSSTVTVTGAKGSLKTASALWIGYTESDFSITDAYASTLTVADGATVAVGEMKINKGNSVVVNAAKLTTDAVTNNGTIFVADSTLADQKISGNGYIEAKNSTLKNNTISGQTGIFIVDSVIDGGSFSGGKVCTSWSYAGERLSNSVVTIQNTVNGDDWRNYGKLNVASGATFNVGYYGDTRTGMTTVAAGGKIVADTYRTYNGVIEAGASVEASAALQFYGIDKSVHNATAGYTINGSAVVKHDVAMGANLLVGYDKTAEIGGANTVVTVDGANAELKVLGGTHSAVANAVIHVDDKGNKATLNVQNGATFLVEGTLTNKGIINVDGATMDIANATLNSTGTITVDGEATLNGDFRGSTLTFGDALVLASTSGFTYDTLAALTFGSGEFTFTNADANTTIKTVDNSVVEVGTMAWDKADGFFAADVAGTVNVGTLEMDLTGVSGTASFDIAKGVDSIDTIKFGTTEISWSDLADGKEAVTGFVDLVYDSTTQTLRYQISDAGYYNHGGEGAAVLTEMDAADTTNAQRYYFGGELVEGRKTAMEQIYATTVNLKEDAAGRLFGGNHVSGSKATNTVVYYESAITVDAASKGIMNGTFGGSYVDGGKLNLSSASISVTINSDGNFKTVVGGHRVQSGSVRMGLSDTTLTINAGTYTNYVVGGTLVYDGSATIDGDSYVNINGGTFNCVVMGSGYAAKDADSYTHNGNTYITISGGTFNNNVYGGVGQAKFDQKTAIELDGDTNIVISGGTFNGNIYGGSFHRSVVTGNTNITLSGNVAVTGKIDGDSSNAEYYQREFVNGSRNLTFDGFTATELAAEEIRNFDEVSLLGNSNVKLTGSNINLNEVSIWNVEEGSSISGFAKNDLDGDTLALFLTDKKAGSWTVMEGDFGTIKEGFELNIIDGNRPNADGCLWKGGADETFKISGTSCTVGWTDSDGDGKKELKITIA